MVNLTVPRRQPIIHVGIDLGTTNTVIASCKAPRVGGVPKAKIRDIKQFIDATNQGEMAYLPSVLFLGAEGNVKVGKYPHDRKAMGADRRVLYNTKIDMGKPGTLYQYNFTPVRAAAEILKVCYNTIRRDIMLRDTDFPSVTITVPASFNQNQIADTIEAAKQAGFENVSILEEPVAALYNYINDQALSGDETAVDFTESKRVLVYDIGGGTCDVCVVDLKIDKEGTYDIHFVVTNRYTEFGGNDFDEQAAIGLLNKLFKRYHINSDSISNLIEDLVARVLPFCEQYKKDYSDQLNNGYAPDEVRDTIFASLPKFVGDIENVELDLTYKEYEEFTKIFFDESYRHPTRDLTDKLRDKNVLFPVHQVLKKLKDLGERGIDCVFLTGGMSRYLPIETALENFCKCPVIKSEEPMQAVALGAAISKFITSKKSNDHLINLQDDSVDENDLPPTVDTRDERPRLAEAIFIDVENQLPMKIIDANITIPCQGTVDHIFHVGANGVRFHLFAGQSQWDPEMRILYDYAQTFKSLVRPNTVAHIKYEIDEDRFLKLTLQLDDDFKQEFNLTVDNLDI